MRLSLVCSPARPSVLLAPQRGRYPGTLERSIGVCLFSCNKCDTGPQRNTLSESGLREERKKEKMKIASPHIMSPCLFSL